MRKFARRLTAALVVLLLLPAAAFAQAAITGVVRDTSGGVLPGVTVETASPALIEKTRSVVTDGTGQYRIVDLRPGIYSVTFTLAGFNTIKREGIELTGTFVATVNADLTVGSLTETIVVSGETPIVDVQSTKVQQTVSRETLSAIPTSRLIGSVLNLIPGVTGQETDVGGAKGVTIKATWAGEIHGGKATEGRMQADGFAAGWDNQGGGEYLAQTGTAQEVVVSTSGALAEAETGGVLTNVIPRDGGNTFSGQIFFSGANDAMQGSNYTQKLKDQGLRTEPNAIINVWDFNPAGGGRIIRDKLWFYLTYRSIYSEQTVTGMYFNKNAGNPNAWTYEPDLSRRAFYDNKWGSSTARLTWQATPRNKIAAYWDEQWACWECIGGGSAIIAPEARGRSKNVPGRVWQATWSSPVSNRILVEAGIGTYELRWRGADPRTDGSFHPLMISVVEQGGTIPGLRFRAPPTYSYNTLGNHRWRAHASYVTGSHNAKFGYQGGYVGPKDDTYWFQDISEYRFSNGIPNQFTMRGANPLINEPNIIFTAFYAQDQWTAGKLTLQGGVRYDYQLTSFDEFRTDWGKRAGADPRRFINPPIVYPDGSVDGVHYHDITPRFGAAYDVFGNGKTAVKMNLGKFPMSQTGTASGVSLNLSPANRLALVTNRQWTDSNKNYVPDCDLTNPAKNNECGAMSNQNFGKNVFSESYDPTLVNGWGVRPFQWEGGVSVQHEIIPRVSANVGYFFRWYGNRSVTDNRAVTAQDFDKFSITAPLDARLPDGGGQTIGDLYDVKSDKFGKVDNYVTAASQFGKFIENWRGVDVTVSARLRNGLTVQGGTSTGRFLTDTCEIREKLPEIAPTNPWCRVETPYLTQARGFVTYTIPRVDVQVSGTWFSNPGNQGGFGWVPYLAANYNVPNAVVAPIIGRSLTAGANIPVNIVKPGARIGDRITSVDFRVAKILPFGERRLQLAFDLYNIANKGVPLSYNQTFVPGGQWLTPTEILSPRMAKLSAQFNF